MDPQQIPLRGLHLPEAVGWWPLAPGWWLLIVLLVAAAGLLLRAWLRWSARAAARRKALKQLEESRSAYAYHGNPVTLGAEVSELLRRTMLAYAPRAEVAGLTGDAWLAWLDRDLDEPRFREGPGRTLLELPYRNAETVGEDVDVDGMLAAVRERLRTPVGRSA
ncbi:MAG: DUF4381 family protein [Gammaproteobacteria bacterium]|nr:DUF4381 family protein [Gammaproteobacteria bacterium]